MTDVITKVSIGGQVYPFAGGGSEGQEVVYLTQAEYDALPASKLTDGKIYKVKTTGVVPGGSAVDRYLNGTPIQEYVENIGSSEHFSGSYSIPNDAEILECIVISHSYDTDKVSPSIFSIRRMKAMPGKIFENPAFDSSESLYYDDTTEKIVIDNLYLVNQLILAFY